jgi:hypothetical protein
MFELTPKKACILVVSWINHVTQVYQYQEGIRSQGLAVQVQ